VFGSVWDVGCGPGNATRALAEHFDHAAGCDPSKEMIARAKEGGGQSRDKTDIIYEVLDAERLDQSGTISAGSVDLLTAAMAVRPMSI
jgi:trans-aconitate methyltransferase